MERWEPEPHEGSLTGVRSRLPGRPGINPAWVAAESCRDRGGRRPSKAMFLLGLGGCRRA